MAPDTPVRFASTLHRSLTLPARLAAGPNTFRRVDRALVAKLLYFPDRWREWGRQWKCTCKPPLGPSGVWATVVTQQAIAPSGSAWILSAAKGFHAVRDGHRRAGRPGRAERRLPVAVRPVGRVPSTQPALSSRA